MLKNIDYKIAYVRKTVANSIEEQLSNDIKLFFENIKKEFNCCSGATRIIALDTIYYFVKHKYWFHTEICQSLFVDYLTQDYLLPHNIAESFATSFKDKVAVIFPTLSTNSNHDFLKYLFTICATSECQNELLKTIGLGTAILQKMQTIIKNVLNKKTTISKDNVEFLAEFDTEFCDIMYECAEEMRAAPWILDIYQLKYLLIDCQLELKTYLESDNYQRLFYALVKAGQKTSVDRSFFEKHISFDQSITQQSLLDNLIEILIVKDLIFSDHGKKEQPTWSLTPLAQKITADAFGHKHKRIKKLDTKKFINLNPYYQNAVIKYLPSHMDKWLLSLLESNSATISPKALTTLLDRISERIPKEVMAFCLDRIIRQNRSPWLRKVACEHLATFSDFEVVGQTLKEMAELDVSPKVRDAALGALLKWETSRRSHPDDRLVINDGLIL